MKFAVKLKMEINKIFDEIVADLHNGNYTVVNIKTSPAERFFHIEPKIVPIEDEATLFEEASKTLLYYFCVTNNDDRYKDYYNRVLIPDTKIELPEDTTFESVLEIISPQSLETLEGE